MQHLVYAALLLPSLLTAATQWVSIRTTDGARMEGQIQTKSLRIQATEVRLDQILSVHNAAPASDFEKGRIEADLAAIQGSDRSARDAAVQELTAIGIPAMTPLLKTLKDTDQHEPRPLYRLFERLMPSYADGFDRTLTLVRLKTGEALRGTLAEESLDVTPAGGQKVAIPWAKIRTLAVRQKIVKRSMLVHSLRHCTQIEYLDTGVELTASSKVDATARGFVRLSWDTDSWASDANGLTKPGGPTYKSNLIDGHPFGALVGRVQPDGEVFFLGKKASKAGLRPGRLALAVNDNRHWQNNLGTFHVSMTVSDAYDLGDAQ